MNNSSLFLSLSTLYPIFGFIHCKTTNSTRQHLSNICIYLEIICVYIMYIFFIFLLFLFEKYHKRKEMYSLFKIGGRQTDATTGSTEERYHSKLFEDSFNNIVVNLHMFYTVFYFSSRCLCVHPFFSISLQFIAVTFFPSKSFSYDCYFSVAAWFSETFCTCYSCFVFKN